MKKWFDMKLTSFHKLEICLLYSHIEWLFARQLYYVYQLFQIKWGNYLMRPRCKTNFLLNPSDIVLPDETTSTKHHHYVLKTVTCKYMMQAIVWRSDHMQILTCKYWLSLLGSGWVLGFRKLVWVYSIVHYLHKYYSQG